MQDGILSRKWLCRENPQIRYMCFAYTVALSLSLPACGEKAGERGLVKDQVTSSPQPSPPLRRGDWSLEIFRPESCQSQRDWNLTARGCEERATLRRSHRIENNPERVESKAGLRMLAAWRNHWRRFWYTLCSPPRIAVHFCATKLCAKNCTDTLVEFCPISNASP